MIRWHYYIVWVENKPQEPTPYLRLAASQPLAEQDVRKERRRRILGSVRVKWPDVRRPAEIAPPELARAHG